MNFKDSCRETSYGLEVTRETKTQIYTLEASVTDDGGLLLTTYNKRKDEESDSGRTIKFNAETLEQFVHFIQSNR